MNLKRGDLIRFKGYALVGPEANKQVSLYSDKSGIGGRSYHKDTVFMFLDLWDQQLKTRIYVITPDSTELHCRFIVDTKLEDYVEVVSRVEESK